MREFSKEIWAYGLRNAIEYGKTNAGVIIPKLFQHGLEKNDIPSIMPKINEIVKKINGMKKDEMEKELENYKDNIAEHKQKEEKGLPELEGIKKNMTFRLAPYPSGALHIGNAKTYLLNALYAEKYHAKLLLVMDDTIGSSEKQISPEAYKLIEDGFKWLKVKYKKPVIYKSDRLKLYYDYAEKLIEMGRAYICHCPQEKFKELKESEQECPCRNFKTKEQMKRWKEMFSMKSGEAVLRIKTSMHHPNPAFRDRVLFKISDRKHPRVGNKYRVWPTLEMSWAIDDHELKISHILRGNDLMIESEMERYIWDIFKWKHPVIIHTGLIKIEGMGAKISKSKAQKEVKSGKFTGWDDPRTWSMQSLERRGIKPEAVRGFVFEIGLNKQDITVPIETLYSINRKMIDADALRYSFAEAPKEIKIEKAPGLKYVEVPVHPDKKEKRKVGIGSKIFISGKDFDALSGQEIRLIHLYNIKLGKKSEFTSIEVKDIPKINWVSDSVKARILMEDGKWVNGLAEYAVKNLKSGDEIQFERFGFARFDRKNKDAYEFWFSHK